MRKCIYNVQTFLRQNEVQALSGTLDGAGGVGGLLMLNSTANGAHFYAYDGNGDVAALVKASDGTLSATYEYEPFGSVLRATGPMAKENRFQFSTKRCDATTDLLLYEYRVLRTDIAKWLSRDPIGEDGGFNVYGFCGNSAVHAIDPDGRVVYEDCPPAARQRIQDAIDKACRQIRSPEFGCCMAGSGLGRQYASRLSYLCRGNFKVKCMREPMSRWGGCALGSAKWQTIEIYYDYFSSDACGYGEHYCLIGHEMLHLLGPSHPQWDRFFNRLHSCLACRPYRSF